jgi:hypothetical protein
MLRNRQELERHSKFSLRHLNLLQRTEQLFSKSRLTSKSNQKRQKRQQLEIRTRIYKPAPIKTANLLCACSTRTFSFCFLFLSEFKLPLVFPVVFVLCDCLPVFFYFLSFPFRITFTVQIWVLTLLFLNLVRIKAPVKLRSFAPSSSPSFLHSLTKYV